MMDQQDGPEMALRLTQPRFCVVRRTYDGSGLYMAYGPRETEEGAKQLLAGLREVGVGHGDELVTIPIYGVSLPMPPELLAQVQCEVFEAEADQTVYLGSFAKHSERGPDAAH